MRDLVLGISGASGAPYAVALLDQLVRAGRKIHCVMSPAAREVFTTELTRSLPGSKWELPDLLPDELRDSAKSLVKTYHPFDFQAGIASGSFLTDGMVICPCSMGTVSAIAHGSSSNLLQRAADVHLKERRKLILVPRETPLGVVQLRNLTTCAEAGAVILPAMPAFYTQPKSIQDMVHFIVGRICDQLNVPHQLLKRWGSTYV